MRQESTGIKKQSAVIPMRRNARGGVEILLITNKSRTRWVIPKGNLEQGMTPPESAAKEAWEEAGALGRTLPPTLGAYAYVKNEMIHMVDVYAMTDVILAYAWPETQRQRRWVGIAEAVELVHSDELGELLRAAEAQLHEAAEEPWSARGTARRTVPAGEALASGW